MNDTSATLNQGSQPERKPAVTAQPGNASIGNAQITPVTSQVSVGAFKPVDSKTLVGSYAGDHRTPSKDTVVLPSNPGPRDPRGQSQVMSSKLSDPAKPQAVTGLSEASQN